MNITNIFSQNSTITKYFMVKFCLFLVFTFFTFRFANAQDKMTKLIDTVKGNEISFVRHEILRYGYIIHANSKYNEEEIMKEYPPARDSDYFSIYLNSNSNFVDIVKTTFSAVRIEELQNENEDIGITVRVSQQGEPLLLSFTIKDSSSITPNELEQLEKEMLAKLKFTTYQVHVSGNASMFIHFEFTFDEIQAGNIKQLEGNEAAYERYLKGEEW